VVHRGAVDLAVAHGDHAAAAFGEREIVGHHDECGPALAVQGEHQVDDLFAGGGVEIAGRFVGEQDRRFHDERTRQRDALLFAAGQFGRIVGETVGQPDPVEFGAGPAESVPVAGEFEGNGDVLKRRHVLNQVKGLEDDTDIGATKPGQGVLVEPGEVFAGNDHVAGLRRLQSGHHHQQRRFARTGRSDDADRFPGAYIEANTPEHMDPGGPAAEAQVNVLETDGVMRHGTTLLGIAANRNGPGTYGALAGKVQAAIFGSLAIVTAISVLWVTSALADRGPIRLVALGDSLSAGFMLSPDAAFPVRLEQALRDKGYDVVVENAGVSGDTTSAGLARVDWSVPEGTDGVILELGANDALRGIDLAVTRAALDDIAERLKERDIDVLVAGMQAPPNMGKAYAEEFNVLFPELADRHDFILYPFFLDGIAADPSLNLDDGMHPNPDGVDVIVERILPYVERLIARIENGSSNRSSG